MSLNFAAPGRVALANDNEIGVEGQCISKSKNELGQEVASTRAAFRIVVRKNGWELRFKADGAVEDYDQVSSEGTNTYYFVMMRSGIEEQRARGEKTGDNIASGLVLKRGVPNADTYDPAGPIWLTFASGGYFRSRASNEGSIDVPSGVSSDAGHDVQLFAVLKPARWKVNRETGLPSELNIFETSAAHGPIMANGAYRSRQWPKPYDQGFTNSVFRVESEREFNGTSWPQKATYQILWMKSGGSSSNDLWIRLEYTIIATNYFDPQEELRFPPNVPGITTVNDARFAEEAEAKRPFLTRTDSRFATEAEARKSKGYISAKPLPQPFDMHRREVLAKRTFYILATILVLLPFPIFLMRRLRKNAEGR